MSARARRLAENAEERANNHRVSLPVEDRANRACCIRHGDYASGIDRVLQLAKFDVVGSPDGKEPAPDGAGSSRNS